MRLGKKLLIVPVAAAAILASARADAAVTYVGPSQDTWVDSGSLLATHAADTSLAAMTGFLTTRIPALQFDLSTIDSASTVVSAVLMMAVVDPDAAALPILVNRITGAWNENTANYASLSPLINSVSWGSMIAGGYGIATADVTTLVQAWVKQTLPNFGLALKATAPAGESIQFSSSNALYPSSRPVLLVNTVEAKTGMRVQTGFYTGNSNSNRSITGLGFAPDVVIVKGAGGTAAVIKTNTMPGNMSKPLGAVTGTYSGRVESLDSNGFTVSNNAEVNSASVRYDWVAFSAAPGYMTTGSYTGDGVDNRNITGLGFQPDYVMVLGEGAVNGLQRFPSQTGDASHTFANTSVLTNGIQVFLADGFQVGNHAESNANGSLHHYIAWNTSPGTINGSTYTGTGATPSSIAGAGFQPDVVIVKRDQDAEASVFRSSSWSTDITAPFPVGVFFADGIKSMQIDGFQVGTAATVNTIAKTYQWVAFRDAATPPESDLEVTVNASNVAPFPGETVALAVSLTNKGPMAATSVEVTNVLPSGLAYVSDVTTKGTFAPATGVWSVGPLANGEQVNLTINARVDWSAGGKRLVDFASVTGQDQADSLAANNTDSVAVNVVNQTLHILDGSYVGNGTNQTISGLGFQPALVIVRGDSTQGTMARTSTMPVGMSKELGANNVLTAGAISGFTAGGFSVGSAASVNATGITYHWSAFEAAPFAIHVGSYVGNGVDDRSITGVGFTPGYLIVMSANNQDAMQRFENQSGDASLAFQADAVRPDRIQAFEADGFQVGKHNTVNQSGQTIHYVAFNTAHTHIASGVYVGDNTNNRQIVTGFSPAQVLVRRGDNAPDTIERFASITGDRTFPVPAGSAMANAIRGMLPDGFEVGPNAAANTPGKIFYWTAFLSTVDADVALSMTVDNPNPTIATLVQFSLTATNNGPATVTGLSVTDLLPAGLQLVSAVPSQGSYDSTSGEWTVGVVPTAATAMLVLTARVAPGTGGSVITHIAAVSNAGQPDPVSVNNTAKATVTVRIVDLRVSATADKPVVVESDTIRWRVDVTNAGPDSAIGVSVLDTIPAGVLYSGYSATMGTWNPGTGIWTVGAMAAGETQTLTMTTIAGPGTAGSDLFNHALATATFPADADSADNQSSVSVRVAIVVSLVDEPLSLYPASAFVGDPQLSLRIGLNNAAAIGVVLDTISTIRFTDGVASYQAQLANPTVIPPGASDFTVRFRASAVPATMKIDTTLALQLSLNGSTTEGLPYAQTISTTGRNFIAVTGPKVRIAAALIGDRTVYPGATGAAVLAFDVVNGYTSLRTLDTLVVSNGSSGPGTAFDLDVSIRRLSLYADSDADLALSPGDILLGQTSFSGGRASIAGSGWSVPATSARSLLVVYDVDSVRCRDSDLLDAVIASAADIRFLQPTTLDGNITPLSPVNSYGVATVDGMVAFQASVSALSDTLFSGDIDRVVATVVLPRNGYDNDVLSALRLRDDSGNFSASDFARLRFFRDNGDGAFSAAADTVIGTFGFSGNRYEVSGLSSVLTGPTTFFAVADVATTPVAGHTFRPGIPVGGIEVASGNDGPIDAPISAAGTHPIILREQIDVASLPLPAANATPGAAGVPALWLRIQNSTPSSVNLDSLRIGHLTAGSGSISELDALVRNVSLYQENGNGVIDFGDVLLATGQNFSAGLLTTPVGVTLLPGTPVHFLVTCDVDSFCAADGDTLFVGVAADSALRFNSPQTVAGTFPMRTAPGRPVDGMMAHEIGVFATADSLIITAPTGNLVFEFSLRGNGYRADTLTTLALLNQGSATSEHIAKLSLYGDGGNDTWENGGGDDVALGDFTLVGPKQYSLALPGVALPAGCGNLVRFFVTADLTPSPTTGGTVQLQIPLMGVAMASGNDGPIDVPATNPATLLIPKPNVLTVFPYSVGPKRVLPGSASTLNFGVGFYNGLSTPLSLSAMNLFQQGTALSSEIVAVKAYADTDSNGLFSPALDQLLSSVSSATSFYAINNINLLLSPKKISYVFVAYDLAISVRDSVGINLQLNSDADLTFSATNVTVQGEFPINSPGIDFTDGMVAAQITPNPAPQYRAAPGEQNVLAIGFTLPTNGFLTDILRYISVRNSGSAVAGTDISAMNLWADDDGDGLFNASQDRLLTGLTWLGSSWRNPVAISENIPSRRLSCFVTANIAASAGDDRTIQLHIPVNGVDVASGNDGPLDAVVTNPSVQTVSTDPLLTGIAFDRTAYTVGQPMVVTMTVRNVGPLPLLGIAPSAPATSGTGAATLTSGPTPTTVDLIAGGDTTIVWTFAAATAGDFSVCGNAATADSAEISVATCTPVVAIENRALDVMATWTDVSPTGVNRGQSNVGVIRVTLAYSGYDTLSADVRVNAVSLGLCDAALTPIAPNSRLSAATLISSSGSNYTFSLADSLSSPVRLALSTPAVLLPGQSMTIDVTCDVAIAAVLAPFRVAAASLGALEVVDANDGTTAPVSSPQSFPWRTNLIDVNDRADSLLVASTDTSWTTINVSQNDITAMHLTVLNNGSLIVADELIKRLTFSFYDSAGVAIAPGDAIRKLSVHEGTTTLYLTESIPSTGNTMQCALTSALLLNPQTPRDVHIRVDARAFPAVSTFYLQVTGPLDIDARDNNSGDPVAVSTMAPSQAFPLRSRVFRFQQPATGLLASGLNLAPVTILPGQTSIPLIEIALSHPDPSGASPVRVDSLTFEFVDATGAPAFPGNFFSQLWVMSGPDTLAQIPTLSSFSPLVGTRLSTPLTLAPGQSDSLRAIVDARALFSPGIFRTRVQKDQIVAVDVNTGQRILGIAGTFPLQSDLYALSLAGNAIHCALQSLLPANVTGRELGIDAMDVVVENLATPGHTPAELRMMDFRVQSASGSNMAANTIVAAARLYVADTLLTAAVVTPAGVRFTIPAGAVTLPAGSGQTVRVALDLSTTVKNTSFRLALADTSSSSFIDVATGAGVTAGTAPATYPLATQLTHVLGGGAEAGFTNYPNPFPAGRQPTRVTFFLSEDAQVTLRVFTLWGAPVATLLDREPRLAGLHQDVLWTGQNGDGDVVNNGVYYMVLEVASGSGGMTSLRRKVGVLR